MDQPPKSRKYHEILDAARDLFWKYGYRKVTVEDICTAAGASKMTFYRLFPNKLELAKAVLDRVVGQAIIAFRHIVEEDTPAPQKMKELIRMKFEGVHDISPGFMYDFYSNPDLGLPAYMAELSVRSFSEMMADFKKAQDRGIFRKDLNLEFFFMMSQKLVEMARDEAFMQHFGNPEEMIMEMANFFVYGIAPHE